MAARTSRALACLAADQGVGGMLFLDLDPAELVPLASWLATAVARLGRPRPPVITLGGAISEDELWLRTSIHGTGGELDLTFGPGLMVEQPDQPSPIFVIPDLASAGLPVMRAVIAVLASDVATAERYGHTWSWRPTARWLAACDSRHVSRMSPHLLDRFPVRLRLDPARMSPPELMALVDDPCDRVLLARDLPEPPPAPARPREQPRLTRAAADRVVRHVGRAAGARRDLCLARTARALAWLADAAVVGAEHVNEAAEVLGLVRIQPAVSAGTDAAHRREPLTDSKSDGLDDGGEPAAPPHSRIGESTALRPEASEPVLIPLDPLARYPEDHRHAVTEAESLRSPWQRGPSRPRLRGQAIGVEPTDSLRDLSVTATIIEAIRSRALRQRTGVAGAAGPGEDRLRIGWADLRRHRRRAEPNSIVVLVLDHSCHTGWNWVPELAGPLREARRQRSAVAVVEFGHADAECKLRASWYRASTVLDPRVIASLTRQPGCASPLAYALDLAAQELQRALRRRRASVERAQLLVVTDGRGNVPLVASILGRVSGPVGRQGVDDALEVARAVRRLSRTHALVISPPLAHYAHLPFELADALGGGVRFPSGADAGSPPDGTG